jgi:hypothetical protein
VDFDHYRFGYEQGDFFRYTFQLDGKKAFIELKAQRRKRIIRELVIGKFLVSHAEPDFMRKALQSLVKEVNRVANFTLISIAVNNTSEGLLNAVTALGMKPIDKRIYFIAKGPEAERIQDWTHWWMFRSDIDTW